MKYEPRILVVEDTTYWQDIFTKILSAQDYRITIVDSYMHAENTLGRQSFDVAIVDIRLSEGDKTNTDGMRVLELIRNAGDPTSLIVVSGAEDVKLTRDAFRNYSVLDFIQKDIFDVKQFVRLVERGAHGARAYGIGPKSLTQTFLRDAGISDIEISSLPGTVSDIEELLQDMFEKIWPLALTPEINSTVIKSQAKGKIVQIVGWSKTLGEAVVARIGEPDIIKLESQNFNDYIKGLMGDITIKIGPFYKKEKLGGIIYVLSGAEPTPLTDFTKYYSREKNHDVIDVVEKMFRYFAGKLYTDKTVDTVIIDLTVAYGTIIESLRKYREQILKQDGPDLDEMEEEDRLDYIKDREKRLFPIEFVLENNFVFTAPVGMVHGDFCDGNIILDNRKRIWTLGFYNTGVSDVKLNENDNIDTLAKRAFQIGKRNLLHDFATMEVSIRKTLITIDPEAVAKLDLALFKPEKFGEPITYHQTIANSELKKAFEVISRIRDLSGELIDFKGDMRLYYAELLFQFFGFFLQAEEPERERIWPTVSKLVERLQNMRALGDGLVYEVRTDVVPRIAIGDLSSNDDTDLIYDNESQPWYMDNFPVSTEIDFSQISSLRDEIDVVLITATDEELKAVMGKLESYPRRKGILRTFVGPETYYLGKFGGCRAVVTKCRMGAIGEGSVILATEQAQRVWEPKAVIMVGIAFGKNPQTQAMADVLVASQIISYEQQRVANKIVFRGPVTPSSATLLNRFTNAQRWRFVRPDGKMSKVHIGAILSGEKLIDDPGFKAELFDQYPQAIGGEMEGAGLCAATGRVGVPWILVKSISDWGDGQKHNRHQPLATAAAASLVHHVLSQKTALNSLKKTSS